MPQILFAEDETGLGRLVKEALEREPGFNVHWVKDGREALLHFKTDVPDICVLDVMMPAMDGFMLARQIRGSHPAVPIIFLTARSQVSDVIKGFESGGNDYLKKPFSIEELVVRIKELLRRNSVQNSYETSTTEQFELGRYLFIPPTQALKCPEATYQLSNREMKLLRELVICKNSVMERKEVLIKIWGDDNFFNARNMDVYISKLRKYLIHDPSLSIVNIRGYGFKLIEQKE
jgi:DNA-binding response OmpR family regulator